MDGPFYTLPHCTRSGVASASRHHMHSDHSSCHAMRLSVPLTLPDGPPFPLPRTWPSRDAFTTSRSLKHATAGSLDIVAHCASQRKAATANVACYDTSQRCKPAERAAPLAGCISTCSVYIAARHLPFANSVGVSPKWRTTDSKGTVTLTLGTASHHRKRHSRTFFGESSKS